MIFLKSNWVVE